MRGRCGGTESKRPSEMADCQSLTRAFSMRPRKSYAYVVPMRRAMVRLVERADEIGYGSIKQSSSSSTEQ